MIYIKTDYGRQALKVRSDAMPRKFHFPFLMCDGVRDHVDILTAEARTGFTLADLDQMVQLGFIKPQTVPLKASPPMEMPPVHEPAVAASEVLPSQQQANVFFEASQMATAMSAKLGLLGFRLNLAVQTASNLADLDALLPQLEKALGADVVRPLAALLKTASR
jgi:hypothetical protein